MTAALGWYYANPVQWYLGAPTFPDPASFAPTNGGVVLAENEFGGTVYFAGISEAPSGTVVWSSSWAPVGSDPSPTLTEPAGSGVGLLGLVSQYGGGPFMGYPIGLLTLTATVDGVALPGHLEWAASSGGTYGSAAWQGVDNVPPTAPPFPAYPDTLPGPIEAPIQAVERRLLSPPPGLRESRSIQRDRLYEQHLVFIFTEAEMVTFTSWLDTDLLDAALWFASTWPSPQGGTTIRGFIKRPKATKYMRGAGWRVEADCELSGRRHYVAP